MANWFKDYHRVLVYPSGGGGEYITACYNGQDLNEDFSFSKRAPGRNRYSSHNSFPGHNILYDEAVKLPKIDGGEWTEECRINFSDEIEIKKFLNKKDPNGNWKQFTGDPDNTKVVRQYPIGKYDFGEKVFVENPIWFPTHYDYNVFREPVWKWLDYDHDYWLVHWAMAMFFKDGSGEFEIIDISHEFNSKQPHLNWYRDRHVYRNYYNQKFPKSRISVDDESFRKDVNYIDWAEENLEVMEKYLVDNNAIDKINKKCWDYLHNAMPR